MYSGRETVYSALLALFTNALVNPSGTWAATTNFARNAIIADSNGNLELAMTAGTTSLTVPLWPKQPSTITQDATMKWQMVPKLRIATRQVKLPSQLASLDSPALFIEDKGEDPQWKEGSLNYNWTLNPELVVYANAGPDPNLGYPPSQYLNALLDAIEAVLVPTFPGNELDLGGLVFSCHLLGRIEKLQNPADGWVVAFVPLQMQSVSAD